MSTSSEGQAFITCPKCHFILPDHFLYAENSNPCPQCDSPVNVTVFPAMFQTAAGYGSGESLREEAEAGCFFHPEKRAVVPCSVCGRFLCSLCEISLSNKHLCPECIHSARETDDIVPLVNNRTLYGHIAVALAVLPLFFFYITIVTAPMAIYIALRYWKRPTSLVRSPKFRYILALLLAGVQVIAWGAGLTYWLA